MAAEAADGTSSPKSWTIQILTLGQGDFSVSVPEGANVGQLRAAIAAAKPELEDSRMKLMFRGNMLRTPDMPLSSVKISDGCTVHMVYRSPEPAPAPPAQMQAAGSPAPAQPAAQAAAAATQPSAGRGSGAPGGTGGQGFAGTPLPTPGAARAPAPPPQVRVNRSVVNAAQRVIQETIQLRQKSHRTPSIEVNAGGNAAPNVVVASALRNMHRFMHAMEPQLLNLGEAMHLVGSIPVGPQRDAMQRSVFAVSRQLAALAQSATVLSQVLGAVRLGQDDPRAVHLDPTLQPQFAGPAPSPTGTGPAPFQPTPVAAAPVQVHVQGPGAVGGTGTGGLQDIMGQFAQALQGAMQAAQGAGQQQGGGT